MENKNKFSTFVSKFGYYIIAFVVLTVIVVAVAISSSKTPAKQQVSVVPLVFSAPVEAPEILNCYSDTELIYNATLNQWESNKDVDLTSSNLDVYACLDGTITKIETTFENGTSVTITHANGFVSVYSSLEEDVLFEVGETVLAGQKIATFGSTAQNQALLGDHLQFTLYKDGVVVDPSNYITLENK